MANPSACKPFNAQAYQQQQQQLCGGCGPPPPPRRQECCSDDDDDSEDDDSSYIDDDDPEAGERRHFLDVCWSFMDYPKDVAHDLTRLQETINGMDDADLSLWNVNPETWLNEIQWRAEANTQFLRLLPVPEVSGAELGPDPERMVREIPEGYRVASRNSSKVKSTLQQFVRDWAREGEAERIANYGPLIKALHQHLSPSKSPFPKVLCPGCGLGRLPFDLARCGYAAQGNEFSYHMLLGSHLVLNRSRQAESFTIYPYALSTSNRVRSADHLRPVKVPDVCPSHALSRNSQLSMVAGEFIEVYSEQHQTFDGVATAFFLDTAKNVFLYIRIIAQVTRPGGIWTNLGPLLYHYADVMNTVSIELSWEEVRPAICRYFDIIEESVMVAQYASNRIRYNCKFFVAVRNSVPTSGMSHPVFG